MKLIKTASGKKKLKISRKEWTSIGKKAGWMKIAQESQEYIEHYWLTNAYKKMKELNATQEQIDAAEKIIKRYSKEAISIDKAFYDDVIMLDFGFIVIGIEKDGYAHS